VADEPTGNLDSRTAAAVFQLFEQLVAAGKTILMVTHDEDLAKRVTRTVTIADGQIVSDNRMPQPLASSLAAVVQNAPLHPGGLPWCDDANALVRTPVLAF
jgi:energy-coupling factor transporter ATP-binding protein EcfA2